MDWNAVFGPDREPTLEDISQFIDSGHWVSLNSYLQDTYKIAPKRTYSKCSGAPGWNVKYQKSGKSLCTLYPMEGSFVALIVIGNKETPETELILPELSEYVRGLFEKTAFLCGGKWLMIRVDSDETLNDIKRLIAIRVRAK